MRDHGWREGIEFVIEERWGENRRENLRALAEDLAAKKPSLFVTNSLGVARLVAEVAPQVPIVQAAGGDLVASGLAKSYARPGGMVTGLTNINDEVIGKNVELLMEAAPTVRHVGVLTDSALKSGGAKRTFDNVQKSLERYAIKPLVGSVKHSEEIEPVMSRLRKEGAQALIVLPGVWLTSERNRIAALALANRWPTVSNSGEDAQAGALISYGTDRVALYRRAAFYVDRILKGTKPGDLPIERPTTFELVVNLKTAKALGITIPQEIMVRADRVIK